MTKYKIIMDGVDIDEVFDSEEEADDFALEVCSSIKVGAETLNMSNPGDYDYDEDNYEDPDYEIIEIEEE